MKQIPQTETTLIYKLFLKKDIEVNQVNESSLDETLVVDTEATEEQIAKKSNSSCSMS